MRSERLPLHRCPVHTDSAVRAACQPLREHRLHEQVGMTNLNCTHHQIVFLLSVPREHSGRITCTDTHFLLYCVFSCCLGVVFLRFHLFPLPFPLCSSLPLLLLCPLSNLQSLPQECCWGWQLVSPGPLLVQHIGTCFVWGPDTKRAAFRFDPVHQHCAEGYSASHPQPGLDPAPLFVLELIRLPWRFGVLGFTPRGWALHTQPSA